MIVRDGSATLHLRRRFAAMRAAADANPMPNARLRRSHVSALERALKRNAGEIAQAIDADFGNRSMRETQVMEIFPVLEAARHARRNLARWMAPQARRVAPYFFPARARVVRQPLGVVGIIAPWNYPLLLALQPLVGALAAGNRALIKMSEVTPRTAGAVDRMIRAAFAADHVGVVTGDADAGRQFATLPFDHLLFTGSSANGRSVMRSAAANLTAVTLELGGKSPAIVGPDAPLVRAAQRIISGKCRNAGQTCIAPDYVLLPHGKTAEFVAAARRAVNTLYPELHAKSDYTSIVNDAHFDRLSDLIDDASTRGATIVPLHARTIAGERATRMMPPMLVLDADASMRIMREEVFGPLLPVLTYRTLDEAIAFVATRPRPLALYYFGERSRDVETVLRATVSGGVCVNDVVLQFAQDDLPFGGIGESGMGAYHGRDGFDQFSHTKAVFHQARRSGAALLEPPYGARVGALLRLLLR